METKPYYKNAKKHPDKQLKQIAKSIKAFGWQQPIVVDKDGVIIVGHGRWLAYEKYKDEMKLSPPEIKTANLSEEKAKAYRLADNKLNESEWDMDLAIENLKELSDEMFDLTGFDRDLLIEADEKDDIIPENPPTVAKLGDIWQLGRHRLMCGDATQPEAVSALMDGKKADMVFTDPPYGIDLNTDYTKIMNRGKEYSKVIGDDIEWDFNKANWFDCEEQFWFGAENYRYTLPRDGSWFVWNKQISEHDGASHTGSLFELCWSKAKHKREIINAPYFRFYGMDTKERLHPTQKPVKLIEWFVKKFSKDENIIADLFLGSGSTLIACEKTNRICYGMEIDEKYCDVIIKRYEDYAGQKATKIN